MIALALAPNVQAEIFMYRLFNHGDGAVDPPPYGMRLDGLFGGDDTEWTFDFGNSVDFDPNDPFAPGPDGQFMRLTYDTVSSEIHIFGTAYGGRDTGSDYAAATEGLFSIDFRYTDDVSATGSTPNTLELEVTEDDPDNNGTITPPSGYALGDDPIELVDFMDPSFFFQPVDGTHRVPFPPPAAVWPHTDLVLFEGWGWLNHTDPDVHIDASDWLFTGTHITPELNSFYTAIMVVGVGLAYGAVRANQRRKETAHA